VSIAYRKEDNVSGDLHKAALSLKEILEPEERPLTLFLFGFSSPLGNVSAFTNKDVELIKNCHGLAVYWFQESVDVEYFHELSPIQKYFVQGVEDQLARRVLYVGGIAGDEFVWLPVPRELADRFQSTTTDEERNKAIVDKIVAVAAGRIEHENDIVLSTPHEGEKQE